jgi:dimethylhistidine N-methyltransferase
MPGSSTAKRSVRLLDLHPPHGDFRSEVLDGLGAEDKWRSAKYFYDERGSHLFDAITHLPEYYPTRTELGIMDSSMPEIAARVGPRSCIIEFGSGSGLKTRRLLNGLDSPVAYVPVEISRDHLLSSAQTLADEFQDLEVLPVCADFTAPFELPNPASQAERNVVFFPGSTIGNFTHEYAADLLAVMRIEAGRGGGLVVGVDLRKDRGILERAYNDARGVTADFNLNLLRRINRELGGSFDLDRFRHRAIWNDADGRIEMYLDSLADQIVTVAGERIRFREGESILTEYSHKYELREFAELASGSGLRVLQTWTDPDSLFSIQYLECVD